MAGYLLQQSTVVRVHGLHLLLVAGLCFTLKEMDSGNLYRLYYPLCGPVLVLIFVDLVVYARYLYIFLIFSGYCENHIHITERSFKIN